MQKNTWLKSTKSDNSGANCVEVRTDGTTIEVRDSKDRSGPSLSFTEGEWAAFISGAQNGEFDLP